MLSLPFSDTEYALLINPDHPEYPLKHILKSQIFPFYP